MTILDLAPPVPPRTDLRLLAAALLAVLLVIFTNWAFAVDLQAPTARLAADDVQPCLTFDSQTASEVVGDACGDGEPANETAAASRARQVAVFRKALAEL